MKRSRSESSRRAVFVMGAMAVAGVLIWSKLRLATDIPRSAYAVPEQTDGPDAPEDDDAARPRPGPGGAGDDRIGPERD